MADSRFAIIEAQGLQFRVAPNEEIIVPHLDKEPGADVTFQRVLLIGGDSIQVGAPLVQGATVLATIVGHEKGEKVTVGTFKRRKKYRRKIGYRDSRTRVKILDIRV